MTRVGSVTAVAAAIPVASARQAPRPELRLHHLHFRVGNLNAALAEAMRVHGGSRVLLEGLGVGVKAGSLHLLHDIRGALEGVEIGESRHGAVCATGRRGAGRCAGSSSSAP